MRHPYYDMIVAKAANMDLVVFRKHDNGEWMPLHGQDEVKIKRSGEYFLCHPKHKDECLHWLNGGEVETDIAKVDWLSIDNYEESSLKQWTPTQGFMEESLEFRIKPRKEKLYIAVKTGKHEYLGGCRKVRICSHAFVSKDDALSYLDLTDSQLLEIEVKL